MAFCLRWYLFEPIIKSGRHIIFQNVSAETFFFGLIVDGSFMIIFNRNKLPTPLNKVTISVEIKNTWGSGQDVLVPILYRKSVKSIISPVAMGDITDEWPGITCSAVCSVLDDKVILITWGMMLTIKAVMLSNYCKITMII